jgi:hypothetical protein
MKIWRKFSMIQHLHLGCPMKMTSLMSECLNYFIFRHRSHCLSGRAGCSCADESKCRARMSKYVKIEDDLHLTKVGFRSDRTGLISIYDHILSTLPGKNC